MPAPKPKPVQPKPTQTIKSTPAKPVQPKPVQPRPAGGQDQQQIESEINALQSQVSRLEDLARLSDVRDAAEDFQTRVRAMPQRVANLRQGGYAFEKELEDQAADFVRQWGSLYPSVTSQINQQSAALQAQLRTINNQLTQLARLKSNPTAARPVLNSAKSAADQLDAKAESAGRMVKGMYDNLESQVSGVDRHLTAVEWMMQQLAEAAFTLLPTESGIMAVKAVWYQGGKERDEDPDGVLYLTDQRLLFEQKEVVATKKVLFITTEKKKVQELEWEAPVALVESVTTSKHGLMKNEDHIHIHFGSGAPYSLIDLHIWQPCDEWARLINRARSRDFDQTRAIAIDRAAAERVKAAPVQCPSCGATITQVVLRGMDSINCEYCGFLIRL
jgi:prefoldin subunit 5